MNFTYLDSIVLIIYLTGITWFGIKIAGKQGSSRDYFLGGRNVPWWAVCFAIVATETSTLTFISIPGLAYLTNMNFLQLALGYFLGRVVVAWIILPAYFRGSWERHIPFWPNVLGSP
jgi:solute:Na+ symporter, SSS family